MATMNAFKPKMASYLIGWTSIQLHKFVSTKKLSTYFQDGVVWEVDHVFNGRNAHLTTVYIKDEAEALLFKLKFNG